MKTIVFLFYILYLKLGFLINKFFKKKIINKNKKNNRLLKNFKKNGYIVINNFISKKECGILKKEIDNFYKKYPKLVWLDPSGSEIRIFGAQKISHYFQKYFDNFLIKSIGEQVFNGKLSNLMVMANRIVAKKNNQGSGSGWHRDAFDFQFKSILYLNDTNSYNGPFQLIKNSEKLNIVIKDILKYSLSINNTRFTNSQIDKLLKNEPERLKTFTGKAGTLIIINTSSIHRGKPLKSNIRYALTNYFYPHYKADSMRDHFTPMLKKFKNNFST
jgi:hypothetical protein